METRAHPPLQMALQMLLVLILHLHNRNSNSHSTVTGIAQGQLTGTMAVMTMSDCDSVNALWFYTLSETWHDTLLLMIQDKDHACFRTLYIPP